MTRWIKMPRKKKSHFNEHLLVTAWSWALSFNYKHVHFQIFLVCEITGMILVSNLHKNLLSLSSWKLQYGPADLCPINWHYFPNKKVWMKIWTCTLNRTQLCEAKLLRSLAMSFLDHQKSSVFGLVFSCLVPGKYNYPQNCGSSDVTSDHQMFMSSGSGCNSIYSPYSE